MFLFLAIQYECLSISYGCSTSGLRMARNCVWKIVVDRKTTTLWDGSTTVLARTQYGDWRLHKIIQDFIRLQTNDDVGIKTAMPTDDGETTNNPGLPRFQSRLGPFSHWQCNMLLTSLGCLVLDSSWIIICRDYILPTCNFSLTDRIYRTESQ